MTRKPVTVPEDQMRLIQGATTIGPYSSRSAVVRNAFHEFFAENEVLLAVVLATMDDVDLRSVVSTVGADIDTVTEILTELDSTVDTGPESMIDEIKKDFPQPDSDQSL